MNAIPQIRLKRYNIGRILTFLNTIWWHQSGKFSFQFSSRSIVEVDAAMAGTLPRAQAGSQQYNPVGLEVGCLYQTLFIDYYFDTILSTQLSVMTLLIMTLHGQVPFLVNNKEKWISGIVEETTCGDVVKVVFVLHWTCWLHWNPIYTLEFLDFV